MAKPPEDSRVPFTLRLPPELHQRLMVAAGSGRSLNAEILERLWQSFSSVDQRIAELEDTVDTLSIAFEARFELLERDVSRALESAGMFDPNPPK